MMNCNPRQPIFSYEYVMYAYKGLYNRSPRLFTIKARIMMMIIEDVKYITLVGHT